MIGWHLRDRQRQDSFEWRCLFKRMIFIGLGLQTLYRYPDRADIIVAFRVSVGIPFNIHGQRHFKLLVSRKPFAEDPGIDCLQVLRYAADALKLRPCTGRNLEDRHAIRDCAALVCTCDIVVEMFPVVDVFHADAIFSYDAFCDCLPDGLFLRRGQGILPAVFFAEFSPEFGDILIRGIIRKDSS